MEYTSCLVCNSKSYSDFRKINCINGKRFNLVKCSCEFIYLNPRPDINSIKKYYNKINYFPHSQKKSLLFTYLRAISFRWKYNIIANLYNDKSLTTLDIGSGDGAFVDFMSSKGWNSFNYDSHIVNNSINFKQIDDESLDLITMWHSIEHMHDISEIIINIKTKIKKSGYIIIACPNIKAAEIIFLKNSWVAYDLPRHIYHFSPQTIELFLKTHNFSIIKKYKMFQDTFFNIYLSLNRFNFIIKIPLFIIISIYSLLISILFSNKSSSYTYICKLN